MAGFIRLAHGVDAGEPVETPAVVRDRYVGSDRPTGPELTATADRSDDGIVVSGETDGERVAAYAADGSAIATPTDGEYEGRRFGSVLDLDDTGVHTVVVAAATDDDLAAAGTAVERLRL
jgi:hypothetical protein